MSKKIIPGTNIEYGDNEEAFSVLRPLIEITGGLSLGQICKITGLQASTIQNWVKRGFVPHPDQKKYQERHISRILLINALRDCMNIEDIGELLQLINGDADDESDDIISETDLYEVFCKAVRQLDERNLDISDLPVSDERIFNSEDPQAADKLSLALKAMVYAYLSGNCMRKMAENLKELRGE